MDSFIWIFSQLATKSKQSEFHRTEAALTLGKSTLSLNENSRVQLNIHLWSQVQT